jgi:apolipoprotein D and lipocalin family protein
MVRLALLMILGTLLAACAGTATRSANPLPTAEAVDLPRFMGTWHVIAHVPYFFERGKVATRDVYRLREDGRIANDFVFKKAFGEPDRRWEGISEVVPGSQGARWKVQFVWPFSTELVVIHVDADYAGAALATPDRKLAWIFGREPVMEAARFEALQQQLADAGIDIGAMRKVPQLPPAD